MKHSPVRDNAIQLAALVVAPALGYLIHGWTGALAGLLLFVVVILFMVRQKMARAQEIGKAQRAARIAGASPWSNAPGDLAPGRDNTANGA